jgi:hypothetical protein
MHGGYTPIEQPAADGEMAGEALDGEQRLGGATAVTLIRLG